MPVRGKQSTGFQWHTVDTIPKIATFSSSKKAQKGGGPNDSSNGKHGRVRTIDGFPKPEKGLVSVHFYNGFTKKIQTITIRFQNLKEWWGKACVFKRFYNAEFWEREYNGVVSILDNGENGVNHFLIKHTTILYQDPLFYSRPRFPHTEESSKYHSCCGSLLPCIPFCIRYNYIGKNGQLRGCSLMMYEKMDMDLETYLKQYNKPDPDIRKLFHFTMMNVGAFLEYTLGPFSSHCDIKPANILLKKSQVDGKLYLKVGDFSLMRQHFKHTQKESSYDGGLMGTPHYMLINNNHMFLDEKFTSMDTMFEFGEDIEDQVANDFFSQLNDAFALGCTLHEIYTVAVKHGIDVFKGNEMIPGAGNAFEVMCEDVFPAIPARWIMDDERKFMNHPRHAKQLANVVSLSRESECFDISAYKHVVGIGEGSAYYECFTQVFQSYMTLYNDFHYEMAQVGRGPYTYYQYLAEARRLTRNWYDQYEPFIKTNTDMEPYQYQLILKHKQFNTDYYSNSYIKEWMDSYPIPYDGEMHVDDLRVNIRKADKPDYYKPVYDGCTNLHASADSQYTYLQRLQ